VVRTGTEAQTPSSNPYEPSDLTAIEWMSSDGVCSERTWSSAALAAEAADDRPRAAMMAAPRLPTVGRNSFSSQASSPMTS